MPAFIVRNGKEDEEGYGYFQKARSKREDPIAKTNYLIHARGQALTNNMQCGYVVDLSFGPDATSHRVSELFISLDSFDSDAKLRKVLLGMCGSHRVVHLQDLQLLWDLSLRRTGRFLS